MGWLCIVACYDSIVVTSEDTGTVSATTACQQPVGQPAKEKHRIGHTTPGMSIFSPQSYSKLVRTKLEHVLRTLLLTKQHVSAFDILYSMQCRKKRVYIYIYL